MSSLRSAYTLLLEKRNLAYPCTGSDQIPFCSDKIRDQQLWTVDMYHIYSKAWYDSTVGLIICGNYSKPQISRFSSGIEWTFKTESIVGLIDKRARASHTVPKCPLCMRDHDQIKKIPGWQRIPDYKPWGTCLRFDDCTIFSSKSTAKVSISCLRKVLQTLFVTGCRTSKNVGIHKW